MSSAANSAPKRGIVVVNVAHRIAAVIQQVIDRDELSYRTQYMIDTLDETISVRVMRGDDENMRTYDVQMLLDMRNGYEEFVQNKTQEQMRSVS